MMQKSISRKEDVTASKHLDVIVHSSRDCLLEGQSSLETVSGHSSTAAPAGEALLQSLILERMCTSRFRSEQELVPSGWLMLHR